MSGQRFVGLLQEFQKPTCHAARGNGSDFGSVIDLQCADRDPTKAVSLLQYRVEYRREIGRRGIDNAQHLGSRRLLFQGLARLGEEPRILDRDDRLRGEILQQRNLLVGKRSYLLTVDVDRTEQGVFFAKGDGK